MRPSVKSMIKPVIQFLIFFFIGALILYFLYQSQSEKYQQECLLKGIPAAECNFMVKVWDDFRSANYAWIFLVIVLFMISNILRALRWILLLKAAGSNVSFRNSFMATMIGYFANLGLPRFGELVKAGLLAKYEKIKVERVLGTVFTDRIIDVLMLLLFIVLTLLLEFDIFWNYLTANQALGIKTEQIFTSVWFWILIILFILGILLLKSKYRWIEQLRGFRRLFDLLRGFKLGIMSIRYLENINLFIAFSVGIWILYYLMTYLCFFAFEPTASLSALAGLLVFVFGSLGIVFPAPGGMGSYHFLIVQALGLYGISSTDAFSFANILFFSIQIFSNILFGIICLILMPVVNRKKTK